MDQTKIWDYFQNDESIGDTFVNARPRYVYIARQIAPKMNVLNIGVGRGGLEAILLTKGVLVSCLDPSEKAIENLRERYSLDDRAKVGFSQAIPFPDCSFDVVIMSEVLEHLADDVLRATLQEIRRVLKNNGRFIGTVPADENLVENSVMCPHCGEPFHRWGHNQSFSNNSLKNILNSSFQSIEITRHFYSENSMLNWKGRISSGFKKLLIRLGVKGNSETFFFLAHKK